MIPVYWNTRVITVYGITGMSTGYWVTGMITVYWIKRMVAVAGSVELRVRSLSLWGDYNTGPMGEYGLHETGELIVYWTFG